MSENITKHYQETVLSWDLRDACFQALWVPGEGLAPGGLPCVLRRDVAPSSWEELRVAHSQIMLWLLPGKAVSHLQGRPGGADHPWLSWGSLTWLALTWQLLLSVLQLPLCISTPSSSLRDPPARWNLQGTVSQALLWLHHISATTSPGLSSLAEPRSLTSPKCLSLKTIFSDVPQGNPFLRHLDWDSTCDTPSPFISMGTSPTKLSSPKQNHSWNPEFSYLAL